MVTGGGAFPEERKCGAGKTVKSSSTQRTACPGAPEASVNAGGSGGSAVRLHRARSWGLGLVLLSLLTCIDSIFKPSCQTGTPCVPVLQTRKQRWRGPFPRWEVWSQGLSRQAGLHSALPPLVTLSLPQVKLAHPCPFFQT